MVAKPNKGLEEDAAPGDLAEAGSSGCPLQKQRGCGQGLQELAPTAPQSPGPWWHLDVVDGAARVTGPQRGPAPRREDR